jgi:alanyl-tRNA synthetase
MLSRLYYTEPWLRTFEATVTDVVPDGDRQHVWLSRTAFYPSSGGQPFDTGRIAAAQVIDVLDGDDDRVVHVVEGATLAAGERVSCEIDWPRRFDHMQQHTGQHLLSAAFERLHEARTESFRLGTDCSTIDLAVEVTPAQIAAAEDDANAIAWEGRPVSIRFVNADEAGRLPLRKAPAREGRLRLIEVEGYDLSACGGTHVSNTGAVGLIAVRGWERFRGGTRVEFVCGGRALVSHRAWRDWASAAARPLSIMPAELPAAIEKLRDENKELRRQLKALAEKTATLEASTLAGRAAAIGGASVLIEALDGYDMTALKLLAASFVHEPARVIVLFTGARPAEVVTMCSGDVGGFDGAGVVRQLTTQFGGRGGGKRAAAQGGGLEATSEALVAAARAIVAGMLTGSPPG